MDIVAPHRIYSLGIVFFQRQAEAINRAQRRAKIMRYRIAEGL
jgi:hypothetical protein